MKRKIIHVPESNVEVDVFLKFLWCKVTVFVGFRIKSKQQIFINGFHLMQHYNFQLSIIIFFFTLKNVFKKINK